jgi:hypothetical protein
VNWKRVLNPRISSLGIAIVLVVLHGILHTVLTGRDVLSVVFSPGGTAPQWMLVTAVLFAAIRILVFTWVPAVLTWHVVRWVAGKCGGMRQAANSAPGP